MGRKKQEGFRNRRVDTIDPVERFLIVCDGEETEKNYFECFRVPGKVIICEGTGRNTVGVVQEAIRLKHEGDYNYTWCVIDRDEFPHENFNQALRLAEREQIQVAYSNESFEIWYLLHFNYYDSAMNRVICKRKLDEIFRKDFKRPYLKTSKDIYELLKEKQKIAIGHAKKLLEQYSTPNPEKDNPSTTVHKLVEELNRNTSISNRI